MNLARVMGNTGRANEAQAAYHDALDIQKSLAAGFPAVPQYREGLAMTYLNLALLMQSTSRAKEAESAYREAQAIYKPLATDFPAVPQYQGSLANTLVGLAELCYDRKDYSLARQLLEESRPPLQAALASNPRNPFFREVFRGHSQQLAATLLQQGDHTGAALAAADLGRIAFDPAGDAYQAACYFARCIAFAENDTKLPEARRKELALSYGDQAMQMLQQAITKGYKDRGNIQKDKDLDPLREREDFKKLVAEPMKNKPKDK
jgi:tetratricopeptide (TPR) repeat protein